MSLAFCAPSWLFGAQSYPASNRSSWMDYAYGLQRISQKSSCMLGKYMTFDVGSLLKWIELCFLKHALWVFALRSYDDSTTNLKKFPTLILVFFWNTFFHIQDFFYLKYRFSMMHIHRFQYSSQPFMNIHFEFFLSSCNPSLFFLPQSKVRLV